MPKQLTSLQHPLVKHLVKLRQNRDYRHEHNSVAIAGIKPIEEVCRHNPAKTLLAYDETLIPKGVKAEEIILVNEAIMEKISGMVSPEGLLAEVGMPAPASLRGLKYILALDSINDPGNLGTLLRTALALGWEGVFITGESCDPFNEKALRAARGAVFRLPFCYGGWDEMKRLAQENRLGSVVADLHGDAPEKIAAEQGCLLLLSNEAHGPASEAGSFCSKVTVPMPGEMESLNVGVAGGILMYLLRHK